MNKKGNFMVILMMAVVMLSLLFVGVVVAIGSSTLNLVFDTAMPEFTSLGVVADTNLSAVSEDTLGPVNTFVQSFTWLTGVLYMIAITMIFGLAFSFKATGQKWLIGFYLVVVVLIVISAIFVSNSYQVFHDSDDEIGNRLEEHALLSFLIIYSPMIFTIVAFMSGIILFAGASEDTF